MSPIQESVNEYYVALRRTRVKRDYCYFVEYSLQAVLEAVDGAAKDFGGLFNTMKFLVFVLGIHLFLDFLFRLIVLAFRYFQSSF